MPFGLFKKRVREQAVTALVSAPRQVIPADNSAPEADSAKEILELIESLSLAV